MRVFGVLTQNQSDIVTKTELAPTQECLLSTELLAVMGILVDNYLRHRDPMHKKTKISKMPKIVLNKELKSEPCSKQLLKENALNQMLKQTKMQLNPKLAGRGSRFAT